MAHLRIVDTHCHLDNMAFAEDLDDVVSRAASAGIHIITSAIEKESWSRCLEIAKLFPTVYASIGLDPAQYGIVDDALAFIKQNHNQLTAIGETGLDHFIVRDHAQRDEQECTFRKMISLSEEMALPIQVHSRSAGAKALNVLTSCDSKEVHMHAFDGKASLAHAASRDFGYYFSIPTSIVRSPQKRKLVKAVEIERLLLETDSPVLGPERTERNEPSNVEIALMEIASILKREKEELREIILGNTLRLYKHIQ